MINISDKAAERTYPARAAAAGPCGGRSGPGAGLQQPCLHRPLPVHPRPAQQHQAIQLSTNLREVSQCSDRAPTRPFSFLGEGLLTALPGTWSSQSSRGYPRQSTSGAAIHAPQFSWFSVFCVMKGVSNPSAKGDSECGGTEA